MREITFTCENCGSIFKYAPLSIDIKRFDSLLVAGAHDTVIISPVLDFCSKQCIVEYIAKADREMFRYEEDYQHE